MGTFAIARFSVVVTVLAVTVLAFAPGARADITMTPMCDAVVNDPTIVTCTCICEGSSSSFPGCQGQDKGTTAPTANQCPDIMQGRRVLSRGDALAVADPHEHSITQENVHVLIYKSENDSSNPGLGVVDGTPALAGLTTVPCSGPSNEPFPQQTRFARLFDLPYDMVVTLRPTTNKDDVTSGCGLASGAKTNFVLDVMSPNSGAPKVPEIAFVHSPQWVQLAIDDFNYDGFDDIFFINGTSITIYTAVDTSDPTKGLRSEGGAGTTLPSGAFQAPINEPTTGDFNGDGLLEAAWIGGDFPNKTGTLSVFFATICPADIAGTICEGAEAFEVILDPASKLFPNVGGATSTIVLDDATLTPTNCGSVLGLTGTTGSMRAGAVVLGNFEVNGLNSRGAPVDELVVTYVSGSTGFSSDRCSTNVQYWTYSPPSNNESWARQQGDTIENLIPQANETLTVDGLPIPPTINLYTQAAYLDWYGTVEQAVIAIVGTSLFESEYAIETESWYFPTVVSVKGTGEQAEASACSVHQGSSGDADTPLVWGLAVGRFSTSTTVNPDDPDACSDFTDAAPGDCPYNPQIAMLVARDSQNTTSKATSVRLYTVQQSQPGTTSSLECANDKTVTGFLPKAFKTVDIGSFQLMSVNDLRAGSRLRAGDAFGDSVRVGAPSVARISPHTQPQMVIQVPPSLVDYVQPNSGDSQVPAVVNFTRAPKTYYAEVEFETTSKHTASTQSTYSYSSSTTESVAIEVKKPNALVGTIDFKNKESWEQYSESNHSEQLGTYSVSRLQTGGMIGADDQVWWTQDTLNVYYFPVIGETTCPASLTCDPSDSNTTGCTTAASGVDLACSESGDGCDCLSEGASAALCPAIPTDTDTRSCAEDGSDVCCSLLRQQLNVNYSGPEQVARVSTAGATLEWYQPKHEPAQILSYPSSRGLIVARQTGLQELATLNAFTTGTNNTSETISWTCGTTSSVSTGTTTRHSFETDNSLTLGMNNIVQKTIGATITGGFDYQSSGSTSSLNTATVGQTASSSVALNLEGAGFFNVDQYAYGVEGAVLGTEKPVPVIDNPDLKVCPPDNPECSTVDEVQADCTTTGPLTVAFAADPTDDGSGLWWSSNAPYLDHIDVALNNPSRWLRAGTSQVADPSLQCRGAANTPICYTSNQPTTATDATDVWDTLFYNMKGLLVTNGATTGPLRDSAAVGDEIFLQARVYNYSLKTMDAGTKVYARIYRQQLDVNVLGLDKFAIGAYATDAGGKPLAAVPIGPTGLGDGDPIPVVSPQDGSATIPPFNLTTDPANDNISIAATSYVAHEGDECEYDDGVQTCNGAYYAYWVTVWAEDASGNVLSELSGHGLKTSGSGAFKGSTTYDFITDVPLETVTFNKTSSSFSNNVGMFKKVFTILPEGATDALTAAGPAELALEHLNVTPERTVLGEPVVVSAQVISLGAATPGATVVFTDGDPQNGGNAFDAEWLPRIRADDAHFVRVNYNPETCGAHEIFVEVMGGPRTLGAEQIAVVDVGIDVDSAIDFLIDEVWDLRLAVGNKADRRKKFPLIRKLRDARRAIDAGRTENGVYLLGKFNDDVEVLKRRGRILPEKADALIAQSDQIAGCVW